MSSENTNLTWKCLSWHPGQLSLLSFSPPPPPNCWQLLAKYGEKRKKTYIIDNIYIYIVYMINSESDKMIKSETCESQTCRAASSASRCWRSAWLVLFPKSCCGFCMLYRHESHSFSMQKWHHGIKWKSYEAYCEPEMLPCADGIPIILQGRFFHVAVSLCRFSVSAINLGVKLPREKSARRKKSLWFFGRSMVWFRSDPMAQKALAPSRSILLHPLPRITVATKLHFPQHPRMNSSSATSFFLDTSILRTRFQALAKMPSDSKKTSHTKKETSTVAAGGAQDTIFFGIKCFNKLLFINRTSVVLVNQLEKFSDLFVFKSHIHLFQPRVLASRMLLRTSQTQHM